MRVSERFDEEENYFFKLSFKEISWTKERAKSNTVQCVEYISYLDSGKVSEGQVLILLSQKKCM